MIQVGGVWLPDNERHMGPQMTAANVWVGGKLTYQFKKLEAALRYVRNHRTALDIGAHVGTWSMHLVRHFDQVYAFEPVEAHRECFSANVIAPNVKLIPCALGDKFDYGSFGYEEGSTGGTHLVKGGLDAVILPLDDFHFDDVDFIKIDVEGYELFVVQGGEQMIRKNKPTMVVEQKPKGLAERYGQSRMAAVEMLQSWGAKIRFEMSGDYCLGWD
jgi:FkbM family methyltransferase